MKWFVAFGRFWWDFIVGDSLALAVGGIAVLILAAMLARLNAGIVAEAVVPASVAATLALSLRRPS